MIHQVLARKWRPKTFADVIGQKHVLMALVNSLTLGRIHHAYLFSGTRGVGKTTIARLLSKGLNCEIGITASPCNNCKNCYAIENGNFIDLIEIDAASRTKVEDTREILDNVQYVPSHGRFKIYLIDEVHMLSRYSLNALLKTLEEPPTHVKFLLATTDPNKLPLTILSRCLHFHLNIVSFEQIYNQIFIILQKEYISAELQAVKLLARAASGSMRDALSLTDQAIVIGNGEVSIKTVNMILNTLSTDHPLSILESLINFDALGVMDQISQYSILGIDWENLLVSIMSLLHRIAISQLLSNKFEDEEDPIIALRLISLSKCLSSIDLQLYYQILLSGRKELSLAPEPRIGIEMILLRALSFHPSATTDSSNVMLEEDNLVKN